MFRRALLAPLVVLLLSSRGADVLAGTCKPDDPRLYLGGEDAAAYLLQTSSAVRHVASSPSRLADGQSVDPAGGADASSGKLEAVVSPRLMPLNSAGLHTGARATVDRILLAAALLLPCAFFVVREWCVPFFFSANGAAGPLPGEDVLGIPNVPTKDCIGKRAGSFRGGERLNPMLLMAKQEESTAIRNVLSGVVISLGCIPEAISFSMIVGISPLNGIWAGVFMGLYSSLMGGRPGMISCSSAATAVVLAAVAREHGMGAMALTVLLCGVLQVVVGILYLSRLIALVPHPVMIGFVNGLAIVIARAQTRQFREGGDGPWLEAKVLQGMVLTSLVSMSVAIAAPRIPGLGKLLPGPLVAIVVAVAFSCAISPWFPQRTLAQAAGEATFKGGLNSLPSWNFPPQGVDWENGKMWAAVLTTAPRMALVGLVESLLTLKLMDQMTGSNGSSRRECFGQGLGNIAAGLFGTQGGCALIGQSLINLSGGGQTRLSSFVMASGLFVSVFLLAPMVGRIPVAALVGLMFLVAINTFAWGSLGLFGVIAWTDGMVILVVMAVTLVVDLATAVVVGLFMSALAFAWSAAKEVKLEEAVEENARVFKLQGPLFFGSALSFTSRIRPERIPEDEVLLDFSGGKVLDHSALDAITKTVDRLSQAGKKVQCRELPADAQDYLRSMRGSSH